MYTKIIKQILEGGDVREIALKAMEMNDGIKDDHIQAIMNNKCSKCKSKLNNNGECPECKKIVRKSLEDDNKICKKCGASINTAKQYDDKDLSDKCYNCGEKM
jgi:predicted amidophosphoribosyltransferase